MLGLRPGADHRIPLVLPAGASVRVTAVGADGPFVEVEFDHTSIFVFEIDLHQRAQEISPLMRAA